MKYTTVLIISLIAIKLINAQTITSDVDKKAAIMKEAGVKADEAKKKAASLKTLALKMMAEADAAEQESKIAASNLEVAIADFELTTAFVKHQKALAARIKSSAPGPKVAEQPKITESKIAEQSKKKITKLAASTTSELQVILLGDNDTVTIGGQTMVGKIGKNRTYKFGGFDDDDVYDYVLIVTHDGKNETRNIQMTADKTTIIDFTKTKAIPPP